MLCRDGKASGREAGFQRKNKSFILAVGFEMPVRPRREGGPVGIVSVML